MTWAGVYRSLLGEPLNRVNPDEYRALGTEYGIILPDDYIEIAGWYGGSYISDFIYFESPGMVRDDINRDGSSVDGAYIVTLDDFEHALLPEPGGVYRWGATAEGDILFLADRGEGRWTVSAFLRNWGEWFESDLGFADWFSRVLRGEMATDWMPEWPPLPHVVKPFGKV